MLKSNRDCSGKMDMKYEQKYDMGTMNSEYMAAAMPTSNSMYMMEGCPVETMPGVVCPPVYECPQERVCHRTICHEVPHICPCNTRIVNHHIYRHSFTPSNVYDGCCGRF